ncbi:MAG TPA: LD-carboxypeptidase [Casimicrobiaceae bacterium]|nr:LD-carboxypeptidase [Casimicrobiaceae bacterium]
MNRSLDFGFFSPAGVVVDAAAVDRAAQRLLALGHRVVEDEASRERAQRFAGDDETRLAAFRRMAARDDVDVAVAVRGGYGVTRLLDRLDFAALARRNRRWMGHSDFSAFQLAALAQAGMVTYAGPMAAYDFGAQEPSPYTLGHCFAMLGSHEHDVEVALDGPPGAPLEGVLWGGNLAIVAHLVGTPYLPQVTGGLLFLEDVSEHPYRVERMLYQLHYAGILARQKAVLLGAFTEYALYPHDDGYDLDAVVAHARERFGVPVYTGLPFGHVRDKLTLPVGGRATLVPGVSASRLVLRDHG